MPIDIHFKILKYKLGMKKLFYLYHWEPSETLLTDCLCSGSSFLPFNMISMVLKDDIYTFIIIKKMIKDNH